MGNVVILPVLLSEADVSWTLVTCTPDLVVVPDSFSIQQQQQTRGSRE